MQKRKYLGSLVTGSTAFAALMIIVLIVLIMTNIIAGGLKTFTFQFLTEAPVEGMTAGGIYPAIVGT